MDTEYVGLVFDTKHGPAYKGGETKMARYGQKYDADGRGSEMLVTARTRSGLRPAQLLGR